MGPMLRGKVRFRRGNEAVDGLAYSSPEFAGPVPTIRNPLSPSRLSTEKPDELLRTHCGLHPDSPLCLSAAIQYILACPRSQPFLHWFQRPITGCAPHGIYRGQEAMICPFSKSCLSISTWATYPWMRISANWGGSRWILDDTSGLLHKSTDAERHVPCVAGRRERLRLPGD